MTFDRRSPVVIANMTTGKHGAYHAMSQLTGNPELAVLPSTNNSYFYADNASILTVNNFTCDMSNVSNFGNTFLCTTRDSNSKIIFFNTKIYFGSSRLVHPLNEYWSNIEAINDPFFSGYLMPDGTGSTYLGWGTSIQLDYSSVSLSSDGTATITPPPGFRILSSETYLVTSTASQAQNGAVTIKSKASDGSSLTFQTGQASSAYAIYYRMTLKIIR